MRRITLGEILKQKEEAPAGHRLYRIETEKVTLYVGQSEDPIDRLSQHLGLDYSGRSSRFGHLVLQNLPQSLCWEVTLYSLVDCQEYMRAHTARFGLKWDGSLELSQSSVDMAEVALIAHFKPCLNVRTNPESSSLPATVSIEPVDGDEALYALRQYLRGRISTVPRSRSIREQMDREIQENAL